MTFALAAIGILLLIVSPPAALAFAIFLIGLWVLVEISLYRVRRLFEEPNPAADLLLELHRLDIYPEPGEDEPRVITDRDHPLAAIGGVPRRQG